MWRLLLFFLVQFHIYIEHIQIKICSFQVAWTVYNLSAIYEFSTWTSGAQDGSFQMWLCLAWKTTRQEKKKITPLVDKGCNNGTTVQHFKDGYCCNQSALLSTDYFMSIVFLQSKQPLKLSKTIELRITADPLNSPSPAEEGGWSILAALWHFGTIERRFYIISIPKSGKLG